MKPITDVLEHFFRKLILGYEGGHWSVEGRDVKGYRQLNVGGGKRKYAHVVAYQLFVGEVPDGYDVDHTCRLKWCCNPAHLEAVTHRENIRRRDLYGQRDQLGRYVGKR